MKDRNRRLIYLSFFFMCLFAITDSTRGVFLPFIQASFQVSDTQLGLISSLSSLSFMVSMPVAAWMAEKYGYRMLIWLAFGMQIASIAVLRFANTYPLILCFYVVLSIGGALLLYAINTIIPQLPIKNPAFYMNWTHCMYGIVASSSTVILGWVLRTGIDWKLMYYVTIVFMILGIFVNSKNQYPQIPRMESESGGHSLLKQPILYTYIIIFGFFVSAESGMIVWSIYYFHQAFQIDTGIASIAAAGFLISISIGRMIGSRFLDRFNHFHMIQFTQTIAILMVFTGLLLGRKGILLLPLSGLFFSINYPTMLVSISYVIKNQTQRAVGYITGFTGSIVFVMHILIGRVSDHFGIRIAMYLIPFSLLICLGFFTLVQKGIIHEKVD
jgi:fucose permease